MKAMPGDVMAPTSNDTSNKSRRAGTQKSVPKDGQGVVHYTRKKAFLFHLFL